MSDPLYTRPGLPKPRTARVAFRFSMAAQMPDAFMALFDVLTDSQRERAVKALGWTAAPQVCTCARLPGAKAGGLCPLCGLPK